MRFHKAFFPSSLTLQNIRCAMRYHASLAPSERHAKKSSSWQVKRTNSTGKNTARYCDGCLEPGNKFSMVSGQLLCPACSAKGTPLQRAVNQLDQERSRRMDASALRESSGISSSTKLSEQLTKRSSGFSKNVHAMARFLTTMTRNKNHLFYFLQRTSHCDGGMRCRK